jgi:hypothetical protein
VQVDGKVRHGQEDSGDVVRDHRGRTANGIAWKGSVEVTCVQRRDAPAGRDGRSIESGQHDDPPLDIGRIDLAHQRRKRDLPFIFVAMAASHEQRRGSCSVPDADDRDRDDAITRQVRRIGHAQPVALLAIRLEVEWRPNLCGACHRRALSASGRY